MTSDDPRPTETPAADEDAEMDEKEQGEDAPPASQDRNEDKDEGGDTNSEAAATTKKNFIPERKSRRISAKAQARAKEEAERQAKREAALAKQAVERAAALKAKAEKERERQLKQEAQERKQRSKKAKAAAIRAQEESRKYSHRPSLAPEERHSYETQPLKRRKSSNQRQFPVSESLFSEDGCKFLVPALEQVFVLPRLRPPLPPLEMKHTEHTSTTTKPLPIDQADHDMDEIRVLFQSAPSKGQRSSWKRKGRSPPWFTY